MIQVVLDTSFLRSDAPESCCRLSYFRHCLTQRIPMWLSTVAAGEFEVGQPVSDLPLQNFRILPYNLPHAIRSASFYRTLRTEDAMPAEDRRPVIINDLKLIAQAEEEGISTILTEDETTLVRLAKRLRAASQTQVTTLLLTEGFTPGRLETPDQGELPLT